MSKIYNCCSLCLKEDENDGGNLIWIDSLQLCESCYKTYTDNEYNKSIMPINAIKRYRKEIENNYISRNELKKVLIDIDKFDTQYEISIYLQKAIEKITGKD